MFYDIYLYTLCYYICCLLWRMYEMHLALFLKAGCDSIPVARSVRAQGQVRRRLLLRPRPGSGEDAIPPEVEVEAEPWGRARWRPPSEA
jgi:hypothetical protein